MPGSAEARVVVKAARFRTAFVQLPRWCGVPAFPVLPFPGVGPRHVRPIKADENEDKTMITPIDFALLINACARFVAALAKFVTAFHRRRR